MICTKKVFERFDGYKTYILAVALVVYAVSGFILGKLGAKEAIDLVFGAGIASTLRHALE